MLDVFSNSSFSFSSSSTSSCCLVPQRRAPLVWWCLILSLQSTLSLETCKVQNMSTQCDEYREYFHPQNPLQTGFLGTASLHQEPFHLRLALHSSSSFSPLEVVRLALLFLFSRARKMSCSKSVLFYVTLKSFRRTMLIERKPGQN